MATHSRNHGRRPAKAAAAAEAAPKPVISIMEEIDAADAAETAGINESLMAQPAVVEPAAPASDSESQTPNPAAWPMTAIDMWTENATALIDLAENLCKAKSLPEAMELQARFGRALRQLREAFERICGAWAPLRGRPRAVALLERAGDELIPDPLDRCARAWRLAVHFRMDRATPVARPMRIVQADYV